MSATQERHDTAEALYKAIRHEVERINEYSTFRERRFGNMPLLRAVTGVRVPEVLETLARAYSTVGTASTPDQ